MGRIHKVKIFLEIESDNEPGVLSTYEVVGTPGDIYQRRTSVRVTPHYGNPGEGPTQVEVKIDAMLLPVGRDQLLTIRERAITPETPEIEEPKVLRMIASPFR